MDKKEEKQVKTSKNDVKQFEMVVACHFMNAALTLGGDRYEMEALPVGILVTSKVDKAKRRIVVPYTNIKAFELWPKE